MIDIPAFDLHPDTREVRVGGTPVALGARAFDVLSYLTRNAGRVVSKQELLEDVWGGLSVEEGNLTVQISAIRKALGARVIATVPGIGYQLATRTAKPRPSGTAPALPSKPSLVVLPFANLTGDPSADYLVDGIVSDLIGSLTRISGIFVIAATSSFTYKCCPVDLADVGRDLGVRYVLEGSIQRAGDVLRISVQLVEADNSHTIWSRKFTGPVSEIFELQDRITEDVTGALEPTLIEAETGRSRTKPTDSLQAYDYLLQAMVHILRLPQADNFRSAVALLDQAIALDPDYALAKAWKCRAYLMARGGRYISFEEFRQIAPLARSLLSDHGRDPLVLSFAALAHSYLAPNKHDAAQAVRLARDLAPNSGLVLQCAGWVLSYVEAYDEAIECFQRTMRFDPLGHSSGYCSCGIGVCLSLSGRAAEAIPALEAGYADGPDNFTTIVALMNGYFLVGRVEEARVLAKKIDRMMPGITTLAMLAVAPYQTPAQQALIRECAEGVGFPP